ncbi:amino acid adenylation domain-containing protein [Kitasatospora sp. NPDC085464]|uniref:amino acid adenylation domain-containing protein n=1 Tax=Kitasatospora sp. NPDC085464 TaxID=3364063 RepID=UPI0037C5590B
MTHSTHSLPVSPTQQGIWLAEQVNPGQPVYNVPVALRLRGELSTDGLRDAVAALVRRHRALRTRFSSAAGLPRRTVLDHGDVPVRELRLTDEAAARQAMAEEIARPFAVAGDALLRVTVLRYAEDECFLLLVSHHLVSDGWSVDVLLEDLAAHYRPGADRTPGPDEGPQEPELRPLDAATAEENLAFWERTLRDAPAATELFGSGRPATARTNRGTTSRFTLPDSLCEAVRAFGRTHRVSPAVTLLAGFAALLTRYSGEQDLVIGTSLAGRDDPRTDRLVDCLVKVVPLRIAARPGTDFTGLLDTARDAFIDALEHQDVALEDLARRLGTDRDGSPLFRILFGYARGHAAPPMAGLETAHVPVNTATAKFDLTWNVNDDGERIEIEVEHRTELIDAELVERLVGHWRRLLAALLAEPDAPVARAELLSAEERAQLVGTAPAPRVRPSAPERFAAQVAAAGDRVAVTDGTGARLTYRGLDERAARLAALLAGAGVGRGDRVGLCLGRSADMVAAVLAAWRLGAAYVPVDPDNPADRIAYVLDDAGVRLVLTDPDTVGLVPAGGRRTLLTTAAPDGPRPGAVRPEPGEPAYVIYTSGSTGRPKGVEVTHGNLAALLDAGEQTVGLRDTDVWSLFHSVAFDFSVWEIWGALAHGGRLVVVPRDVTRDPAAFLDLLVRERVTVLNQTPSAFRQLAAEAERRPEAEPSLRLVVFGGEALDPAAVRTWWRRRQPGHPVLVNMYGITETTVHVTWQVLDEERIETGSSPIGRALPGYRALVLDAHGEPVPVGVQGELHVGGEAVARGYLGRPDLTAQRFVPDPFGGVPGARLYRSGDLARWNAHGELEYLGRNDDQVKIRGFRIELGEVAAAIGRHPSVRGATAVVREDTPGDRRLVAYAACPDGTDSRALRDFAAAHLPAHMVPAAVVVLDALPLTRNGKVDRAALPAPDVSGDAASYVAPRTPAEEVLAEVWAEVLRVERVGADDGFFDLGGDSIRAVQVAALARGRGLGIAVAQIYRHRTLADLAAAADTADDRARTEPFGLLSAADRARIADGPGADLDDAYPMTALQVGMIYHMASDLQALPYVNAASYRLPYRFDEEAFRRAVRAVVARHPVLRTGFDLTDYDEPLQLVHREADVPLVVEDLRALNPAEQDRAVDELLERERRPFDLERPPMLRLGVQVLTDDSFQWTLVEHHSILDGWSLWSTITEILLHYTRLLDGAGPAELPPPASAYRDFVALEQRASASPESRRFWSETLAGHTLPQLPALAEQAPRPAGQALRGDGASGVVDGYGWRDAHLPAGLGPRVGALARRLGVPEKTVLLAAHLQVIAAQTGLDDVCCGVTLNGRLEETGGTEARGLFLNTVPFRLAVGGGRRSDLVRRVFEAEAGILPHRRMPLARIRQLAGGRDLFTTNFTFNNFHVMRDTMGDGAHADLLSGLGELTASRRVEPADVPLTVTFFRNPLTDGLQLCIDYDAHRLTPAQVEEIAEQHVRAVEALVTDPEGELAGPAAAPAAARTATPVPQGVLARFAAQVAANGDATAVADAAGGRLTYRGLDERAARLAALLAGAGIGRGDRVGLCLGRSADMVAAVLAVWRLGAAHVPIDPDHPASRIEFVLKDADVPLVLTDPGTTGRVPDGTWRTLVTSRAGNADQAGDAGRAGNTGKAGNTDHGGTVRPEGAELAYVIYTSGSTGTPKGVEVDWRSLDNLVAVTDEVMALRPDDRLLQFASLSFDVSVADLVSALTTGAAFVVSPGGADRVGEGLVAAIRAHRPTVLSMPPSVLAGLDPGDLPALRRVVVAGEALPAPLAARWAAAAELVNAYGPTEATVYATAHRCAAEGDVLIGRAVPGAVAHVLDGAGRPVPPGVRGELCIGGVGVARGYLGRPALTAERFVPDPTGDAPGARLYRTGDVARWTPAGELEYLGRTDDQVKVRGLRIELGEVEAHLRAHPGVAAGAAAALGEGAERRLVGYVVPAASAAVPAASAAVSADEVRAWLGRRLPASLVPSAVVVLDALPLSPSGKVDRAALPAPVRSAAAAGHVAPHTPLEEALARVWAEILKVERVGAEDDFFDLGGDSVRAVQIAFRIKRELGLPLKPVDVQLHPTVAELARHLAA